MLFKSAKRLVCAVSVVSRKHVILPDQLLSVARLIVHEPAAPNGVTSFTAPFRLNVHFDAFVKAVEPSVTEPPIVFVTHSVPSGASHFC